MQQPVTISVVTVCRNCLPQLQKTVESVLAQTYPSVEYIIIDGASTDGTVDYLQQLADPRVQWLSEPDRGIYDAMNKGIARCTGQWTCFMNAGDTFYQDDTILQVFNQPCDADVIYGDVYKEGQGIRTAEPPHNAHRMYFCHQSAFTRTAVLREVRFDVRFPYSADFMLYKQLFLLGYDFLHVPLPVANFDTTGVSNTHRAAGIRDNIAVVRHTDTWHEQLRLLPRLYFQLLMCKIRKAKP